MHVTLLNYTQDAEALLIFTKQARLGLHAARLDEIRAWPPERRAAELAYMADTIPSSWEFVDYVFCVEGVSRAYTHQQVRTRTGSYAQQSLRVVDAGEFDYVWPQRQLRSDHYEEIADLLRAIKSSYKWLVADGVAVEDARGILPTNIATNIVCKFNLRTLSELAASRTGGRTQDEYRAVVAAMCGEVMRVHPWAESFLFPRGKDYFAELESFAEIELAGERKTRLLKLVDKMRKERAA